MAFRFPGFFTGAFGRRGQFKQEREGFPQIARCVYVRMALSPTERTGRIIISAIESPKDEGGTDSMQYRRKRKAEELWSVCE